MGVADYYYSAQTDPTRWKRAAAGNTSIAVNRARTLVWQIGRISSQAYVHQAAKAGCAGNNHGTAVKSEDSLLDLFGGVEQSFLRKEQGASAAAWGSAKYCDVIVRTGRTSPAEASHPAKSDSHLFASGRQASARLMWLLPWARQRAPARSGRKLWMDSLAQNSGRRSGRLQVSDCRRQDRGRS